MAVEKKPVGRSLCEIILWDFQPPPEDREWQKSHSAMVGFRVEWWPDWSEEKDSQAADSWQIS